MENVKNEKIQNKLELSQSLVSMFSLETTLQGPAVSPLQGPAVSPLQGPAVSPSPASPAH